LLWFC